LKHRVPALAALSAELFAVGIATSYPATNNWFGAGDLPAMVILSLPLVLLVYFSFRTATRRIVSSREGVRYLVLPSIGALLGIITTVLASLILGGWILAFSFPVLFCWVVAGLLAGVVAAWLMSPKTWPIAVALTTLIIFALFRASVYAQAPEPRLRVVLAPGLNSNDVNRFWQEVIGSPGRHPGEHALLDGISGAGVADYENGSPVIVVSLSKHLRADRRDVILARIRQSPLVRSASPMSAQTDHPSVTH
jgi:hypothetical protein